MRPVLAAGEMIWRDNGFEFVITSARDGIHSAGSLHYYGLAVDIRASEAWGYKYDEILALVDQLEDHLGDEYDVVLESDHIHVEYDPD